MAADLERQRARLVEALSRDRAGLTRYARAKLAASGDDDAEDVVSDVVLRLFERADVLAQVENLTAYLFRAVANGLTDLFRRNRHRAEELSEHNPDPAATPEQALEQVQLRRRLDAALAQLSPAERDLWLAVEVEGQTFRQLADRWGQPMGTLLSRKARATKTLRRILAAETEAETP